MLRAWKCPNSNCKMNQQGLIRMTDQPAYARVVCEECGAVMGPAEVDTQVVFVGDYPDTVRPTGSLPIQWPGRSLFSRLLGHRQPPTIADADVASYPEMAEVCRDPLVLWPDLYSYLQTCVLGLVRQGAVAATVVAARCPSHHLRLPLSKHPPVGLHVEANRVQGKVMFGIYPLVSDGSRVPWYTEVAEVPYDYVGANEQELAQPKPATYKWRQLFYLLTQKQTTIIFIDEGHRVASVRTAALRESQAGSFAAMLRTLESCRGERLAKPEMFGLLGLYNKTVKIEEVCRRFPSLS